MLNALSSPWLNRTKDISSRVSPPSWRGLMSGNSTKFRKSSRKRRKKSTEGWKNACSLLRSIKTIKKQATTKKSMYILNIGKERGISVLKLCKKGRNMATIFMQILFKLRRNQTTHTILLKNKWKSKSQTILQPNSKIQFRSTKPKDSSDQNWRGWCYDMY